MRSGCSMDDSPGSNRSRSLETFWTLERPRPEALAREEVSGAGYGDRNRLGVFSRLLMACDFWRQALHPQRVSTARKSTDVLAVPLSSPRVLETFWTR